VARWAADLAYDGWPGCDAAFAWDKNPDGTERGPKDDLAAAKKLINDCGYHRRDEELSDAEEAAKGWD